MDGQQIDYCTLFPDKIISWDISQCCKAHDLAYTLQALRLEADKELYKCIADSSDAFLAIPAFVVGGIVFLGVRLFGKSFYKRAK